MQSNARCSLVFFGLAAFFVIECSYGQSMPALPPFVSVVVDFDEGAESTYLFVQGGSVDWVLALERVSLRGDGFAVFVDSGNNDFSRVEVEAPKTWRGSIVGDAGGVARLSMVDGRVRGVIATEGEQFYLAPAGEFYPNSPAGGSVLVRVEDLPHPSQPYCGVEGQPVSPSFALGPQPSGALRVAVDVDFEQFVALNSDVSEVVNFVDEVFNLSSPPYEELDLAPRLVALVVRSAPGPYNSGVPSVLLAALEEQWTTDVGLAGIPRTLTHLFSGKAPEPELPTFPQPLLGFANGTGTLCDDSYAWTKVGVDIVTTAKVFAHGVGHGCGASHCSTPCSFACGPVTADCAIMCSSINGCSLDLTFSSEAGGPADQITSFVQGLAVGCLGDPVPTTGLPFEERFDSGSLSPALWAYQNGIELGTITGQVSGPDSLILPGSGAGSILPARVASACIDASTAVDPVLTLFTRNIGVQVGEPLDVEYLDSVGVWQTVEVAPELLYPDPGFELRAYRLLGGAHPSLRIRVTNNIQDSTAFWAVDDLRVTDGVPAMSGVPVPIIDSVEPDALPVGSEVEVIICGNNFVVDTFPFNTSVSLGPFTTFSGAIVEDSQTIRVLYNGSAAAVVGDVTVTQFGQTGTLVDGVLFHETSIGVPDVVVGLATSVDVPLLGNFDRDIAAFAIGVAYNVNQLEIIDVQLSASLPTPDFQAENLAPLGEWTVVYVRSFQDPTIGIPAGMGIVLADASYDILAAGQSTTITFDVGAFGQPLIIPVVASIDGDFLTLGEAAFDPIFVGGGEWFRGDADSNGTVSGLIDGLFLLKYGFQGGATPPCFAACDIDDNGSVSSLIDSIYLLSWQFSGGPPPPEPFQTCGPDASPAKTCLNGGNCP